MKGARTLFSTLAVLLLLVGTAYGETRPLPEEVRSAGCTRSHSRSRYSPASIRPGLPLTLGTPPVVGNQSPVCHISPSRVKTSTTVYRRT